MSSFAMYFVGGETPDHRKRLIEQGAQNIAVSYSSLRPRLPKTKVYKLSDKGYPETTSLLITPGFSAKRKAEDDVDELMDAYHDFVNLNYEAATLVCEFDHPLLERDQVANAREEFWDQGDIEKFMAVWRPDYGIEELEALCEKYHHLAIPSEAFDLDINLQPVLNRLIARHDVQMHALGLSQPDVLLRINFSSCSSTSWTSPTRFGDRIIWDGSRLRRYPVSYKERANRRHRMLFERAGFDPEKIAADDPKEVLNFTIWSWLRFEEWMSRHRQNPTEWVPDDADGDDVAATEGDLDDEEHGDLVPALPATKTLQRRHVVERDVAERTTLPVFGFQEVVVAGDAGEQPERQQLVVSPARSLRSCDSCHVAATCPAFKEEADCAYDLPVVVRTRDQYFSVLNTLMEIQAQRIGFLRFAEELEGGYPDKNLSVEMDRMFKMASTMRDLQENRESLRLEIETRGRGGVLSRLFGSEVGEAMKQLPEAIDVDDIMEATLVD